MPTVNVLHIEDQTRELNFVNFVLFTRDRILTNETQLNCFIPLSYSLIYIGCVKSYSAKFVRNHSLIRYSLHCDWLLPSTDLKGHSRLRWLCKPINVHNVHTHHLTCVTHESKSPTQFVEDRKGIVNPFTPKISFSGSSSPYFLPYSSCDVSLKNLVLDQLIIPFLRLSFILITCVLDIVLIL